MSSTVRNKKIILNVKGYCKAQSYLNSIITFGENIFNFIRNHYEVHQGNNKYKLSGNVINNQKYVFYWIITKERNKG